MSKTSKADDPVRVHTDSRGNVDFTKYRKDLYEIFDKQVARRAATKAKDATPPATQVQRDDVGRKR